MFSKLFVLFFVLLCVSPVFAGDNVFSAETCRASAESFLGEILRYDIALLKPVAFRVEIATATPPTIKILAKTLADAYVEGFDAEFVEKKFAEIPFESVVTTKCPLKEEQLKEYAIVKTFVAGEVRNFILAGKLTEWFVKFNEYLYNALDPQWVDIVRDFEKKKKYPKAMWDTFERFFPDATLKKLTVTVKPYAVLWDGLGAHYESTMKSLSDGVESAREFSCSIDIMAADVEVEGALVLCADKLSGVSLEYLKALLSQEI